MLTPFMGIMSMFVRYFGKMFVLLVWVLLFNMLYVSFTTVMSEIYKQENLVIFLINLVFGVWLAVNTFFHYAMGWLTNPGVPPITKFENVVTICKKCIAPKPARTHHCSICRRCVLKMDHHCPWFDNCIGFYNHRYFFMFCSFIAIDCFYLTLHAFPYYAAKIYPNKDYNIFSIITQPWMSNANLTLHDKLNTIEFFVMLTVSFAVGGLALFNALIISNGSTNIEIKSINLPFLKSNQTPNVYDRGFKQNWKLFLGFQDYKSFFRRVVLPSWHKPIGDGVNWYAYVNYPKSGLLQHSATSIV